jgi:hypothetical protein
VCSGRSASCHHVTVLTAQTASNVAQHATPIWVTLLLGVIAAIGVTVGPYLGAKAALKVAHVQARTTGEQLGHTRENDGRSRWWEEAKYAFELCGSDNPRKRVMGLAMLEALARSEDTTSTERDMIAGAAEAFISEETKATARKSADSAIGRSLRRVKS